MGDSGHIRKRKRTPMNGKKKLLLGQRVEVRSTEDGFQGSWHAGVITDCGSGVRKVKYDHLLCDDESDFLTENVEVSSMVDGFFSNSETPGDYRSRIRPTPPVKQLGREKINYGLCVDAYYNEAWWEGVVFDMEGYSDHRKVFFPDLGDEMNIKIKDLRTTLDWDEDTEEWKPRGKWLFLEIIEEHKKDNVIPVSIKQIWYDVRERNEFCQIGEWASPVKHLWQDLVVEVINDHLTLAMDEFLRSCDFSEALSGNGRPICAHDSTLNRTTPPDSAYSKAIVGPLDISLPHCALITVNESSLPKVDEHLKDDELAMVSQDTSLHPRTLTACNDQVVPMEPKALSIISSELQMLTEYSFHDGSQGLDRRHVGKHQLRSTPESDKDHLDGRCKLNWQPAYAKLKIKPEFCPQSIHEYFLSSKPDSRLTRNVRNHLCYLGWKVDCAMYRRTCRVRYTSPEGKRFYLIRSACEDMENSLAETSTPMIEDTPDRSPNKLNFVPLVNADHKSCMKTVDRKSRKARIGPKFSRLSVEPDFCPEAVSEYLKSLKKGYSRLKEDPGELLVKARKHLAAMGWSFWFKSKKGKRDEWRYDSPTTEKTYNSLKSACNAIAKGEELDGNVTSSFRSMEGLMCSEEPKGQYDELLSSNKEAYEDSLSQKWSRKYSVLRKYRAGGIKKLRKKKNGYVHSLSSLLGSNEQVEDDRFTNKLKNGGRQCSIMRLSTSFLSKKRKALGKVTRGSESKNLTRVLRSSKRVRQAELSSSSQAPRTVLSWLIDNNAELAKTKVYYRRKRGLQPMAEGRITREGIKCVCCRQLFTLSGFEAHAGSYCRGPAANIFLEDGRTLVECQMEVIHQKFRSYSHKPLGKAKGNRRQTWNDNVCSVCHYGGELILCDQCPSSFHASCLNLQVGSPYLLTLILFFENVLVTFWSIFFFRTSLKVTGSVHHAAVEFVVNANLM
ncbi:hypothetical protein Cgig2_015960 [Carnegiea gigantea]|uniref:Agenet domain-containing protein n=1 Tax=Carnegiea gigantea TaxID=171969 RepID=A0A9Q1QLJ3_9CARY|nr:hypothetical protein Cgig2_015960 [Carnegiea gigantea]